MLSKKGFVYISAIIAMILIYFFGSAFIYGGLKELGFSEDAIPIIFGIGIFIVPIAISTIYSKIESKVLMQEI